MKAKNIEEFFGTLQQATVEAWKKHLKTDKYSSHMALNDFYEDIVELVDALIEEYMGKYGKVKDFKNIMTSEKIDAVKYLEELHELAAAGRDELIDKKDTELHSDIDAILSLIDSTLYKLKELDEHKMGIVDYIKNRMVTEASSQWKQDYGNINKGVDVLDFTYRGNKKFGFLSWIEDSETAQLIAVDSLQEYADAYSVDVETNLEKMFKLKIGEAYKDSYSCYTMRIW